MVGRQAEAAVVALLSMAYPMPFLLPIITGVKGAPSVTLSVNHQCGALAAVLPEPMGLLALALTGGKAGEAIQAPALATAGQFPAAVGAAFTGQP